MQVPSGQSPYSNTVVHLLLSLEHPGFRASSLSVLLFLCSSQLFQVSLPVCLSSLLLIKLKDPLPGSRLQRPPVTLDLTGGSMIYKGAPAQVCFCSRANCTKANRAEWLLPCDHLGCPTIRLFSILLQESAVYPPWFVLFKFFL